MSSSNLLLFIFSLKTLIFATTIVVISATYTQALSQSSSESGGATRSLLSFKETPGGGNTTFDCSPSGPCVPCTYSEKNDEIYRCSETGYRIPLKCVETENGSKEQSGKKSKKGRGTLENSSGVKVHTKQLNTEELTMSTKNRRLLDDSNTTEDGRQAYITYRSCIPAINEEKLSVLGFEGIIFCLLLTSGSFMYYRRKQTGAMSGTGAIRIPTSSRF